MWLIIDIIKLPLMLVSLAGILWLCYIEFRNDNIDGDEEGQPWLQIPLLLLALGLLAGGLLWVLQLPVVLQNPVAHTIAQIVGLILIVMKWPLIIASIYGINWIVWWLYLDNSDDDWLDASWWLLIAFGPFFTFATGARNPIVGLQMLLVINVMLIIAIYYQLPPSLQHTIVHPHS